MPISGKGMPAPMAAMVPTMRRRMSTHVGSATTKMRR
jgi:hypothetical protein